MKYILLFLLQALFLSSFGQNVSFVCGSPLKDSRDGNVYQTVLIGRQCWMKQNLNIGKQVNDFLQTDNKLIEKTCYLNNKNLCDTLGGLYTWEEAMQYGQNPRGICPAGWHIPSNSEWQELAAFLGVEEAGTKLKTSASDAKAKWDGTNESGFTALPAGAGNHEYFKRKGQWALFWTSTSADNERAWFAELESYWYTEPPKYKNLYTGSHFLKSNGFSVRCLKDN